MPKPIVHAFIDAQNLIQGTKNDENPWKIDLFKFRKYLKEKYNVSIAYYFVGAYEEKYEPMYRMIRSFGYEIVFREHDVKMRAKKKGNVDTDIVFSVMNEVFVEKNPVKVILVSGDGDYKKMVKLLLKKRKLTKLLYPNKHWSSLYKDIDDSYFAKLYTKDMRKILSK